MPARQDQTLQIFLIVFIFLFLVTSVVAYLGWKGYSDSDARAAALQNQVNEKNTANTAQQDEIANLRSVMGFGPQDSADSVKEASGKDLATFGPGLPEESRTYRKVLETVAAEGQRSATNEAKYKETLSQHEKDLLAVQTSAKKQIDEYDAARKKAEENAATLKNNFDEDRKKLETTKLELQKTLDNQKTAYETKIAEQDKNIKTFTDKVGELEHAVAILKEQRKDEPGSFEVADGRISRINQNGTVWINLGEADSLRRQVTFSVFDADQHDAQKAQKKGSIEVTRVMGEHMAEARIIDDDATNPILTGDNIYSQVWHRGKKLHFALTGIIDIDNDGVSDVQLARNLIELNGGIVDAYVKDDGKIEGKVSASTRYLVIGDFPEAATQVGMQAAWNSMNQDANSYGVQIIDISQFLNQMGYKPQDRSVPLGAGASAHDFPARPEDTGRPVGGPRFRPRSRVTAPVASPAPTQTPAPAGGTSTTAPRSIRISN